MERPFLEAQGLHKRFGALEAVKKVHLTLRPGEILAFLGKNGAGKSTTVKMLSGLLLPDEGEVRLLGKNPFREPLALKHLGAVLEGNRNTYWRLTPLENLVYFGVARGLRLSAARKRALELLEEYALLEKAHTEVRHLSRGMQQKLALLQAPGTGLFVLLPMAPEASLARSMLAEGAPLDPLFLLLAFLNGLLYLGLGLFLFKLAVHRAKKLGLLHGY